MQPLPIITSIFFDPTTDYGFKKLFGDEAHKDVLMDFLNSMMPDHHQIASLTFQKTEQLPDHEEDRKAIFDILCTSSKGETFIVEMQKSLMTHFIERCLYYSTFPIQSQAPKGKWNFALSPVYVIAILDFDYDKNVEYWKKRQLLRTCKFCDEKGVVMTDKVNFKYLQLPFFTKKPHQLRTHFDKWCYFLKNLESFDVIPNILNEPIFMKAFEIAKVSKMDKNDYILYQISKSKKYDMELVEEAAEQRGKEENEVKVVLSIHNKGFNPLEIADLSSIPIERVLIILKQNFRK